MWFTNFKTVTVCKLVSNQLNQLIEKIGQAQNLKIILTIFFLYSSFLFIKIYIICFYLQFNKNNWAHSKSLSGFLCTSTLKTFFKCAFNCVIRYFFNQLIWYKFADCLKFWNSWTTNKTSFLPINHFNWHVLNSLSG